MTDRERIGERIIPIPRVDMTKELETKSYFIFGFETLEMQMTTSQRNKHLGFSYTPEKGVGGVRTPMAFFSWFSSSKN